MQAAVSLLEFKLTGLKSMGSALSRNRAELLETMQEISPSDPAFWQSDNTAFCCDQGPNRSLRIATSGE